ncbi:MAG TPA: VCBS domain-containing protein [Bacteroidales bacterium]|nr:VCBS domain-containing protein [Bacteroidales bacterium]HQL69916.1 VCBS domain-containing protein [Bacteroidales bacterium]
MRKTRLLIFAFFALIFISSCTSFEEGSYLSLRSVESRINGAWTLETALINDLPDDSLFNEESQYILNFGEQSVFEMQCYRNGELTYSKNGSWQYNPDNRHISYMLTGDSLCQDYYVTRLTNSEMWLVLERSNQIRTESSVEKRYIKQ